MKLNRCPICRCNIDIFALAKDEATSQLLAKLAKIDTLSGTSLMDYLTLFAPAKTALTANKALRLVTEVEALSGGDWGRLAVAMATTVDIQRAKQQRGETVKPFTTHNYLKKVFEQMPNEEPQRTALAPLGGALPSANATATVFADFSRAGLVATGNKSKTAQTMDAINARKLK